MAQGAGPKKRPTEIKRVAPCAAAADEAFTMFVPLGQARYFGGGELMLNNRGNEARVIQPRWYVTGRGLVQGPVKTLPPSKMDFYSIAELLPPGVQLASVTGLEIGYVAKSREIWSQAVLKPTKNAQLVQSMDTPFSMRTDFKSGRLEATFPITSQSERLIVSLANTSDQEIEVQMTGDLGQHKFKLPAKTGELVSHPVPKEIGPSGFARIETGALPGALRAAGFVVDDGKMLLARFVDTATAVQEDLFAGGVPVRGRSLRIALANTSGTSVTVNRSSCIRTPGSRSACPRRWSFRRVAHRRLNPISVAFRQILNA